MPFYMVGSMSERYKRWDGPWHGKGAACLKSSVGRSPLDDDGGGGIQVHNSNADFLTHAGQVMWDD